MGKWTRKAAKPGRTVTLGSNYDSDTRHMVDAKLLLTGFSGKVYPGEMVLVLGRPGSGCTTFLKTIADRVDPSCEVVGDLLYSGRTSGAYRRDYPGGRIFCAATDVHLPTLTVEQTLKLAINSKLPDADADTKQHVLSGLLDAFKLTHQANTYVGDTTLRGVSGGEKKRVSVAEALIARPSLACWDNTTLGLDAGSALDFVKSLRILTDVYQMTTFAALYQASDSLYDLFDKVIVIEGGQEIFFGPASAAKSYFEQLGFPFPSGQPIADYLTNCVDPRHKPTGSGPSPTELAAIYKRSEIHSTTISGWDNEVLSLRQSNNLSNESPKSPTLSYQKQVFLLAQRHITLRLQDLHGLVVKMVTAITVSIVLGTMYWQLPETSAGAFTRGGIIFTALLYNAFTAFVELPSAIAGRAILEKHTAFGFHCASALYIGQIMGDIPLAALEVRCMSR